ncbi:DUF2104 domain-containing protein [Methanothermobacter wolfeii]|uniref:DUF2104 domain-containing protein n=1 Tax=Methanothermobacter wolfeii TaxID=145261 RepID=A0A9E7UNQ7_METWO|nr:MULTISPECIES: DUF2104 domain-containing protein [Methanothermobacter]QHN06269.1 DUF2104 domain-containing protein [Methanothermobacter sp. THM-1]UXH32466.1 DUF2104 domain-containing protein [Methanothermobacter wolfeii]
MIILYEIYLIYTVSFIAGSILGLLLSYRKYREPFVTERIDPLALAVAVAGWMILINPWIYTGILRTLGFFMVAMVAGMRPGYGRYETLIGAAAALMVWIITGAPGW